jgi:hypothetical protein
MVTSELQTLQPIASPRPNFDAIDTPNHNTPTCSQCRQYDRGICRLKAEAGWEDDSHVSPQRKACFLADLLPF